MKRIITSAGLVALGAASLQAAMDQNTGDAAKPWSVSVALRGFYDSNYSLSPSGHSQHSWGMEASPSASINLPMDQTFLGASYVYTLRYYVSRPNNDADHTHQFNVKLDHQFNENYQVKLSDTFVYAQDPTLLEQGQPIATAPAVRNNLTSIHNNGRIDFLGQLTPLFGLELAYNNNLYGYDDSGHVGSYSSLLDRTEHLASLDARFNIQPETVILGGYQFGYVDHTSDDLMTANFPGIPGIIPAVPGLQPSVRNQRSHYFYGGVDHTFSPYLSASARVGAQYTDYFNDPFAKSKWTPYADGNVTWRYMEGSSFMLGVRHSRNQTDQLLGTGITGGTFTLSSSNLVMDQESTAVYANLTHSFTAKITGTLMGQYQNSEFNGTFSGGGANLQGTADDYYIIGANVGYHFNQYFLAEGGYNFDKLNSSVPGRGFTRHVIYLGFRATY